MEKDLLVSEEELTEKQKKARKNQEELLIGSDDSSKISEDEINERVADFYRSLSESGGKLYEVSKYFIKDKEDRTSVKNDFCGYGVKTIPIIKFEIKKHFFFINGELEIPIIRTRLAGSNGPWYFYNKEEAYGKAELLTDAELKAVNAQMEQVRQILEDLELSKDYLSNSLEHKIF